MYLNKAVSYDINGKLKINNNVYSLSTSEFCLRKQVSRASLLILIGSMLLYYYDYIIMANKQKIYKH